MQLLIVAVSLIAVALAASCPDDCSLNGECIRDACVCDAPWAGPACATMQFLPSLHPAAYGYEDGPFNPTSWGGNALPGNDGLYHLFVAEMAGDKCGLHIWGSQSQVAHAVADSLDGPFKRHDTAIGPESHNPQAIQVNDAWYIFHIGNGNNGGAPMPCNESLNSAAVVTDLLTPTRDVSGSVIHRATSPNGPWTPVDLTAKETNWHGCNNPSPFLHPNGTLFLACTWSLTASHSGRPEGPWTDPIPININVQGRIWEDPFLWIDGRGNFHILAHTYVMNPYPANSISGHGWSRDGVTWDFSLTEPYGNTVLFHDGTNHTFSTMERPKLMFRPGTTVPTHLFNGVSPVPPPCAHCDKNLCVQCKVSQGSPPGHNLDWTYTTSRPLKL